MDKTVTVRQHLEQLETAERELLAFNAYTQRKLRTLLASAGSPQDLDKSDRDKVKTLALRYCRDRIKLNSLRNCIRVNAKNNPDDPIELVDEQLAKWGYLAISITKTQAEDYIDSFSRMGDTLQPAELELYDACEQLVLPDSDNPEDSYAQARERILNGADLSSEPFSA